MCHPHWWICSVIIDRIATHVGSISIIDNIKPHINRVTKGILWRFKTDIFKMNKPTK